MVSIPYLLYLTFQKGYRNMNKIRLPFLSDLIKKNYKPDCHYCRETLEKIHNINDKKLGSYHSIIVIKPDYNASGIITHYHIVDYDNPKQLKEDIDFEIYKYECALKND